MLRFHSPLIKMPNEVYHLCFPENRRPRFEPRSKWPRGAPCAKPSSLFKGRPGAKVDLQVAFHAERKHLPVVMLRRAARPAFAAQTRCQSGTTLRLRAELQFNLQSAFNFQRTTVFAQPNASDASPFSQHPPQNR